MPTPVGFDVGVQRFELPQATAVQVRLGTGAVASGEREDVRQSCSHELRHRAALVTWHHLCQLTDTQLSTAPNFTVVRLGLPSN